MSKHTQLPVKFLDSLSQLKAQGKKTQEFGSQLLNSLPDIKAKNDDIQLRKASTLNSANAQTTQLAQRSNEILQQTFEAEQTPFYDVLAFFTDQPSFTELDNQQELIASQMNTLSQATNVQIGELADEQLQLQQNLKLQQDLFTTSRANTQAIAANLGAQTTASNLATDAERKLIGRMQTGDLQDLQAGRTKAPGRNLTEVARQLRIRAETVRLEAAGSKAKIEEVERNFFERRTIPELISIGEEALAKQTSVNLGNGFAMSPRTFLAKVNVEQEKLTNVQLTRANSAIAAGNVFNAQLDTNAVIARESQGRATAESTAAAGTTMFLNAEFENSMKRLAQATATENPETIRIAQFGVITQQAALNANGQRIEKEAVAREQTKLVSDASKQGAAEFIAEGRFENDLTAAIYIDEKSQIGTPESVAGLEKNRLLQEPIAAFLTQLQSEKQAQLGSSAVNEDGELDMTSIMAAMFNSVSGKQKLPDMIRAAVNDATILRDGEQVNIRDAMIDGVSKNIVTSGLNQMAELHKDQPRVMAAITRMLTNAGGFVKSTLDDRPKLLNALANETAQLRVDGVIDDSVNLATELRKFMVDPKIYAENENLFKSSTAAGAGIQKFVFANDMGNFISDQMIKHWRSGANDEELVNQEAIRLNVATKDVNSANEELDALQNTLESNIRVSPEGAAAIFNRRAAELGQSRRAQTLLTDK